ncbi:MAG: sugar ABC transporter permease, partial [Chloroflexota bacterium]
MSHNFLRNRRTLKEYLTGYLMIAPAVILIFTFGIFPVAFALYVSLYQWRIKQGDFVGVGNYLNAIGSLAYLLMFALGIASFVGAFFAIRRALKRAEETKERPWLLAIPG